MSTMQNEAPESGTQVSSARVPSCYQQAVYADVATGKGHVIVRARAGAGKTTTIMGALASVPRGCTVALFAFNKAITEELKSKAPKGVEVKTLHSHGYSAVRRAFPGVRLDEHKSVQLCEEVNGPAIDEHPIAGRYGAVRDLVKKAKDVLVRRGDLERLDQLVDEFGVDGPTDEEEIDHLRERGHAYPETAVEDGDRPLRKAFVELAMKVLELAAQRTAVIDFEDMCWLPVVLKLRVWAFDRVFVDETQDLSPCQIELLLLCCKYNGRITAVGDDRQAIYAFRGADVKTIPNLIARLNARVLPLSVTYRCCLAVVELAQSEVPDLEAAPGAVRGRVVISTNTIVENALPGDMVISRTNAPLTTHCLRLLKAGKRAVIKGRDIGEAIVRLIERFRAKSVEHLIERVAAWERVEILRLEKRKRPTTEAEDKAACILALTEDAETVADVISRAKQLFSDAEGRERGCVTLGTTHKLKGLEADRVWMLEDTYRRNQGGEEANCWYVAVTRAKTELMLVRTPKEKA